LTVLDKSKFFFIQKKLKKSNIFFLTLVAFCSSNMCTFRNAFENGTKKYDTDLITLH